MEPSHDLLIFTYVERTLYVNIAHGNKWKNRLNERWKISCYESWVDNGPAGPLLCAGAVFLSTNLAQIVKCCSLWDVTATAQSYSSPLLQSTHSRFEGIRTCMFHNAWLCKTLPWTYIQQLEESKKISWVTRSTYELHTRSTYELHLRTLLSTGWNWRLCKRWRKHHQPANCTASRDALSTIPSRKKDYNLHSIVLETHDCPQVSCGSLVTHCSGE